HEVPAAPRLVQHERVLGVRAHGLHEGREIPAVSHAKRHSAGARLVGRPEFGEPEFELAAVCWELGNDDLARRYSIRVGVLQHGFDEFAQFEIEFLVDDPGTNTTDAPAAHDELLYRGREFVVG